MNLTEAQYYSALRGPDDSEVPKANFTFGNAMYMSVVTLSTVGYGDISPATSLGKVRGSWCRDGGGDSDCLGACLYIAS